MSDSIIYDNIFEAIRALDPHNMVFKALTEQTGDLILNQNHQTLNKQNEKHGMSLCGFSTCYFRGEPEEYERCIPSLYRIRDERQRLIAQLKTLDFIMYLETNPDLRKLEEQRLYVDYLVLAQYYGFATNMLDLTNDILTAAYFATHVYDPYFNKMTVASKGVGQIRWGTECSELVGRLHMIGLQPLVRPGLQSTYGINLSEAEDFADMSANIKFHQDAEANQLFNKMFFQGEKMYFPDEGMNFVVRTIQNSDAVTSMAILRYCKETGANETVIRKMVLSSNIFVVDAPLVCNNMSYYVLNHLPAQPISFRPIMVIG